MAKYKCSVCGFIFDEEKEGKSFEALTNCPVCGHPSSVFERVRETEEDRRKGVQGTEPGHDALAYDPAYVRHDPSCRYMEDIHEMALTGKTIIAAMGTKMPVPGWDDILILGAQLNPPPLDEHAQVNIRTVIGKNALKPMVLEAPVYISHMSFGALSREVKVALARGTAMAGTAMCSGEGGILPEEMRLQISIFLNMCRISTV